MTRVFVDTSAWYAVAATNDASHERAVALLGEHAGKLVTTDHVLIEAWAVARHRRHRHAADALIDTILGGNRAEVLNATAEDIRTALRIGELFTDQDFSMTDRTSWAVMERCGIDEAISFDIDFSVYRYGFPPRRQAFTVYR